MSTSLDKMGSQNEGIKMKQPTLSGLEPTLEHRVLTALVRGLRDYGVVDSVGNPLAGHDEAVALYGYLKDAGILPEEPAELNPVELELKRTCAAAPEQYDLFRDGRQIGYLRLRHGYFRAHYPDHSSSEPVYSTGVRGDGLFYDDEERSRELRAAAVEILRADGVENPDPRFEIEPFLDLDEDWESGPLFELMARAGELAARSRELEEQRLQERQRELYILVDRQLDGGASSTELVDALRDAGYLTDQLPQGHGGTTKEN